MTAKLVLFGNFEFGDFAKGNDRYPCTIIHSIDEKVYIEEDEIEDFMAINNHDGWLVPSECKGELLYSKQFMKELSA
jgi:hypothetical protein